MFPVSSAKYVIKEKKQRVSCRLLARSKQPAMSSWQVILTCVHDNFFVQRQGSGWWCCFAVHEQEVSRDGRAVCVNVAQGRAVYIL